MHIRWLFWLGAGVFVAAVGGLGLYLVQVGLDDADKIASVVAMFAALVGLALAVIDLRRARAEGAGGNRQLIEGSTVGRDVAQVSGVSGSVKIGPGTAAGSTSVPPTVSPVPPSEAAVEGESAQVQAVRSSTIGGSVNQVADVDGDVEVRE